MSEITKTQIAAEVDRVLARAGLTLNAEDRERLIQHYPAMRRMADLVRPAEIRDAEPGLVFRAGTDA